MNDELIKWREDQKHLPEFMRDFHDCKNLFKTIQEYLVFENGHPAAEVSWLDAHFYTIDAFLWFMAEHGYTLQKSRAKINFTDIRERLFEFRELRSKRSLILLGVSS